MKTLRVSSLLITVAGTLFAFGSAPIVTSATNAVLTAVLCLLGIAVFTSAAIMLFVASGFYHKLFRGSTRDRINDWANLIQLVGAFAFIGSCIQALNAAINHSSAQAPGWQFNFGGSVLFLISSGMALLTLRGLSAHNRQDVLTRWSSYTYLFGSVLFMLGSVFALAATVANNGAMAQAYGYSTAAGAVAFAVGAFMAFKAASGTNPTLRHMSLLQTSST